MPMDQTRTRCWKPGRCPGPVVGAPRGGACCARASLPASADPDGLPRPVHAGKPVQTPAQKTPSVPGVRRSLRNRSSPIGLTDDGPRDRRSSTPRPTSRFGLTRPELWPNGCAPCATGWPGPAKPDARRDDGRRATIMAPLVGRLRPAIDSRARRPGSPIYGGRIDAVVEALPPTPTCRSSGWVSRPVRSSGRSVGRFRPGIERPPARPRGRRTGARFVDSLERLHRRRRGATAPMGPDVDGNDRDACGAADGLGFTPRRRCASSQATSRRSIAPPDWPQKSGRRAPTTSPSLTIERARDFDAALDGRRERADPARGGAGRRACLCTGALSASPRSRRGPDAYR